MSEILFARLDELIPTLNSVSGDVTFVNGISTLGVGKVQKSMLAPVLQPVIVIGATGQSNIALFQPFSWTVPPNLKVWNNTINAVNTGNAFVTPGNTTISTPMAYAAAMANRYPNSSIYLVTSAFSGRSITYWLPGTGAPDVYADFKANVEAALLSIGHSQIDRWLWWQGEADTMPIRPTYLTDHSTLMARFHGETWFPRDVPQLIFGIASTAISLNPDGDNMNVVLEAVATTAPDRKRFIYTPTFNSTYWDALSPGHPLGLGYSEIGKLGVNVTEGGTGRNLIEKIHTNPVSGNLTFYNPAFATAKMLVNFNTALIVPQTAFSNDIIHIIATNGNSAGILTESYNNFNAITQRRANGTFAAPTNLKANDLIASYGGQGYDGTTFTGNRASLTFSSNEDWTGSVRSTYGSIVLTKPASDTFAESLRFKFGSLLFTGLTSGTFELAVPNVSATSKITLPAGTTDFTATGGALQYLKQASVGGAFTVGVISPSDILLTGYVSGAGTLAATDTILQAFNKLGGLVDNDAWIVYTPGTVTSGAGTPTTTTPIGRYKKSGKKIVVQVIVSVVAHGTASADMLVPLPFTSITTANSNFYGSSFESSAGGGGGIAVILGNFQPTLMRLKNISAATYWVDGYVAGGQVEYEIP